MHTTRFAGIGLVLIVTFSVVVASPAVGRDRPRTDPDLEERVTRRFKRLDRNGDGKLAKDEFPPRFRGLFDRIDANSDGVVELAEDLAFARSRSRGRRHRAALPAPSHANVRYGTHERNVLDLWLAKSEAPAPLVIYYHGGGFRGGDKRTVNPLLLKKLLAGGVSVAAVNYRLSGTAPFPAQMHDCAYALQFLRHHAAKYNIDPKRVGATGGSAGSGISQWLAFHDDLADAKSKDPVRRQSTRISAAVVYAAQCSYDPRFIQKLFNTTQVDGALIQFFGMKSAEDVKDPKFHPLFEEASPINHATAGDPPVMLFYPQPNKPLPPNSPGGAHIHHPKFGLTLKKKLDALGVECVLKLREDCPTGAPIDLYAEFFFKHLGVARAKNASPTKPPQ